MELFGSGSGYRGNISRDIGKTGLLCMGLTDAKWKSGVFKNYRLYKMSSNLGSLAKRYSFHIP